VEGAPLGPCLLCKVAEPKQMLKKVRETKQAACWRLQKRRPGLTGVTSGAWWLGVMWWG